MMAARVLGLFLVGGAVISGTVLDRVPVADPRRAGDQFVLAGDFHVHAFVGDGGVPPWELGREARRRKLDVIVVSNHNQLLAARLSAFGSRIYGADQNALIIPAEELTAPGFHMVAAGITRTIDWRLPPAQAIAAIHEQGGVAIAAHPGFVSSPAYDEASRRLLDGSEVAHPAGRRSLDARVGMSEFYERSAAVNPTLAPIGSSDFHFGATLGECRTFVFADEYSTAGVLDAIRRGSTVASDGYGTLTGDPARVEIVRGLLSADPPPRRASWPSRLAAYASVLGILILLLLK
jgi:predicted metal-dependent phosphoesterase TrpH